MYNFSVKLCFNFTVLSGCTEIDLINHKFPKPYLVVYVH